MKNLNRFKLIAFIGILVLSLTSCSNNSDSTDNTITGIAKETPNLSILVQALQKADLATTLSGSGPFTVFAPTNEAFQDFLTANGFETLNDVPVDVLKQVLLNHVVSGAVQSSALSNNSYIKTLAKGSTSSTNTLSMFVSTTDGVTLNGESNVTTANVIASNGVIHIVDAVIGLPTIVTLAASNPNFSTLTGLLSSQNLVPTLNGTAGSPFTVFAPNNDAFTTFETQNPGTLASLTSAQVTSVLTYHVVGGANVLSTGIPTTPITTLESGTFTIAGTTITDEVTRQTSIIATDVQGTNGVIHVINNVLLPTL